MVCHDSDPADFVRVQGPLHHRGVLPLERMVRDPLPLADRVKPPTLRTRIVALVTLFSFCARLLVDGLSVRLLWPGSYGASELDNRTENTIPKRCRVSTKKIFKINIAVSVCDSASFQNLFRNDKFRQLLPSVGNSIPNSFQSAP